MTMKFFFTQNFGLLSSLKNILTQRTIHDKHDNKNKKNHLKI